MAAASSSNSVTNTQSSTNNPPVVKQEQPQDVSSEVMEAKEVKKEPLEDSKDVKKEPKEEPIGYNIMDDKARIEKMKKYEADFKQYLMNKYFSDKTLFEGNIFDTRTNIEGETISASRLAPYESFADPVKFMKLVSKDSGSSSETSTSKGKSST